MVRYRDTSLLVPFYIQESRTADAQNWLAGLGTCPLTVSPWGIAEFSSALVLKNRRGELTQADILIAEAGFRRFVADRTRVANIAAEDFYRAAELCRRRCGFGGRRRFTLGDCRAVKPDRLHFRPGHVDGGASFVFAC